MNKVPHWLYQEIRTAGVLLGAFLALLFGAQFVFAAWAPPTTIPPGGNVPAPVNVGSDSQIKSGGLWVNSLGTDGGAMFGGDVSFTGTLTDGSVPWARITPPSDGKVSSYQKISSSVGGGPTLVNYDKFGSSVASIGDLDGNGVGDVVIGAENDRDGGLGRGAVYVLFMGTSGTAISYQKISDTQGGFIATLDNYDNFGGSVASIGDLNKDGVDDIAVGAFQDDDGGADRGAVYILFMNASGTVSSYKKISSGVGGGPTLVNYDKFGSSVASIGDLNKDGVDDIAVGAWGDDDGGSNRGAVYVLFMGTSGTAISYQKISDTQGSFIATLDNGDEFGSSVASIGDLNKDGVDDIAVGAWGDDDGGVTGATSRGAVYILFMNANGTVSSFQKISDTEGNFTATFADYYAFGISVAYVGDLNGNGVGDLAVGAFYDSDGGTRRGAIYILFMNDNGTVSSYQKISDTQGNFTATLDSWDYFGKSIAFLGDLNGDGIGDLAVGAYADDDGGTDRGAAYIIFPEEKSVSWGRLTNVPTGLDDGDQVGITLELDPTVLASVKDGISWTEISSRPAGLDDGDDVGISGSGSIDYIPKFTGAAILGNSSISEGLNFIKNSKSFYYGDDIRLGNWTDNPIGAGGDIELHDASGNLRIRMRSDGLVEQYASAGAGIVGFNNWTVDGFSSLASLILDRSSGEFQFLASPNLWISAGNNLKLSGNITTLSASANVAQSIIIRNWNGGIYLYTGASYETVVDGNFRVTGKARFPGGIDPPYISFSSESHESIREYAKDVDDHEKVMQFWNGDAHRLEIYVVAEDMFYTITGELIDE